MLRLVLQRASQQASQRVLQQVLPPAWQPELLLESVPVLPRELQPVLPLASLLPPCHLREPHTDWVVYRVPLSEPGLVLQVVWEQELRLALPRVLELVRLPHLQLLCSRFERSRLAWFQR